MTTDTKAIIHRTLAKESERPQALPSHRHELRIFMVAGEHSGDALGGKLMAAINAATHGRVRYLGVGGDTMRAQGLVSQFPLTEVAVMGAAILPRLPRIIKRVYGTVDAAIAAEPNAVVIIDAPDFTHPIAKRIRRRRPDIPIIDYVSPSVWAWRPGRARRMRGYIDHVLGLLPFEPAAHLRLGGPPCTYVGHPLIEKLPWIQAVDPTPLAARLGAAPDQPILVVLPGSRRSEIDRLMAPFGETLTLLRRDGINPAVIIPVVSHLRPQIEEALQSWPVTPLLVEGEEDKIRAFKLATAALAASGTVTLELALAGTPMVVGYKVDGLAAHARHFITTPSIILANLVLGENAFPEFLQKHCLPSKMAEALVSLLSDTPERRAQLDALSRVPGQLALSDGTPSGVAASIVLRYAQGGRTLGK
ncbi:MAG: lipid-A-disaccharide synthase [Hyphomicrobiaceae bacterium]